MICPVCRKVVEKQRYKIVAIDRPIRINIQFHWECYLEIEDMNEYITENISRILAENDEKQAKISKKG